MTPREEEEERNKRIGWITTVSVQLVLLIICYLIIAWREPYPPNPEYGIELGFETSSGSSTPNEEVADEPASANLSESDQTEDIEEVEEVDEAEAPEEKTSESPTEVPEKVEVEESQQSQESLVSDSPNEVEVKQETDNSTEEITQYKPQTKPVDTNREGKPAKTNVSEETEVKEQVKEVDARAVMGGTNKSDDQTKETEGQSVDKRAIYGQEGADVGETEGASLTLSGWLWDFKPQPDDQSNETGKIVFSIELDREGNLRNIVLQTSTVSPSVAQKYREAVQKLTFSKTAKYNAAEISKGTITFIITSK